MDQNEQIRRYLAGEMDQLEQLEFETAIENSPALRNEVEFNRQMKSDRQTLDIYQLIVKIDKRVDPD